MKFIRTVSLVQLGKIFFTTILMTVLVACGKQDDLDLIAPTLSITSPTPGSSFSTNRTVTIEGETSDDATVVEATLNDVAVPGADISLTGTTFTINVTLVDNANNIVVKVSDDAGNNRSLTFTLYFPQLSIPNGADAALVLGQADFTSNAPNQGGTVGASTLSGVTGTLFKRNNTVLYVPDGGNHRILGFNNTESTTNESADIVIGQANFTSSDTGTSATRFDTPTGVYATDSQFFVADKGNHRVLIWDSIPNNGSVEASTVIGQTDLTSNNMNCTPSTLNAPSSVFVVDGKVIVADNGNNRVLIYNAIPDTNGVAADLVLGQQNLNTCQPNDSDGDGATDTLSGATLSSPGGIWTDGARLLIADTGNNRVLVWDDLSTVTTGQAADHVLGQADMTSDVIEPLPSDSGLNNPLSVTSNGNQIFVADSGNHRVLGWNAFPTTTDKPVADSVIGQSDFSTNTTGATAGLMTTYDNVFVANEGVYVVDGNRVLRFSEPQ